MSSGSIEGDVVDGVSEIVRFLGTITNFDVQNELSGYLIRLLRFGCRVAAVRRRAIQCGSVNVLVQLLRTAISRDSPAYTDATENIILILGILLSENSKE